MLFLSGSRRVSEHPNQSVANDDEPCSTLAAPDEYSAPAAVVVEEETFVSVTFRQTARRYYFGRLTDPEDVARFGPLARRQQADQPRRIDYAHDHLESLAYTLALRVIAT